ncbi:hypothetical protein L6164_002937 [Bauhinia variegata]|uniref:Uncharacterized protein n=1 Tax=Bauhinia variegata TaxID=167791 RepID=A0ACB9PZN9_BAUVA|nr:hypothetical protein L6164_002937 [Bauhinia variegata]
MLMHWVLGLKVLHLLSRIAERNDNVNPEFFLFQLRLLHFIYLKCKDYPYDWCTKAEPMQDDRRNADDPCSSNFRSSLVWPSTVSTITENTILNIIYRRKKLQKNSTARLKAGTNECAETCQLPFNHKPLCSFIICWGSASRF